MADDYVLRIEGVSKAFPGVQALDRVDMQVGKGEVHCLVGENGSGKSTLIGAVSGSQTFDSGTIVLNGNEYTRLSTGQAMNEGVQVIYQDLSLFPDLTVAENIAFNWIVRDKVRLISPKAVAARAQAGLDQLQESLDPATPVKHLSMAQKQIVAIARALVLDARIIFMDEPTTALTKHEIDSLFGIIHGLRERGIAAVLDKVTKWGIVDTVAARQTARARFEELAVKARSTEDAVATLSGGNQQRVVIGKWLATRPRLLILDGPTVGIDVASKSTIHQIIHTLAGQGMAIIIISDEIPEVYKNSSRIVVMRDGAFVYETDRDRIDQEQLRTIVERGVPA